MPARGSSAPWAAGVPVTLRNGWSRDRGIHYAPASRPSPKEHHARDRSCPGDPSDTCPGRMRGIDVELVGGIEDIRSLLTRTFKEPDGNLLMVCQNAAS